MNIRNIRTASLLALAFPATLFAAPTFPSPGFPTVDPLYSSDHYFLQMQYAISNYINPGTGNSVGQSDTYASEFGETNVIPITSLEAQGDLGPAFDHNQTIAGANLFASVGNGTAKVYTHAYAHAGVALAQASVSLTYIDTLTVTSPGIPQINVAISGNATRTYLDQNDYANSYANLDMYIWPTTLGVPAAGKFFTPAIYQHYNATWQGETNYESRDTTQSFTAGSTWYVGLVISAYSNANLGTAPYYLAPSYPDIDSTADFSHTVNMQITGDPSTPDFAYTMASGIDYTQPVPEPRSALLLLVPTLLLLRRPQPT